MEDFVLCFPFPFIFIFFSPWASLNTLFLKIDRILLFFLARSTSVIYNAFAPRHFCRCLTFSRSLQEHCVVLAFLIFHVEEGKKNSTDRLQFQIFPFTFLHNLRPWAWDGGLLCKSRAETVVCWQVPGTAPLLRHNKVHPTQGMMLKILNVHFIFVSTKWLKIRIIFLKLRQVMHRNLPHAFT